MNPNTAAFIRLMKHPLRFRAFLFTKLPSAYFAGVRIKEIDDEKCVVTVPYKWFTTNPFRSIYFACLAMAAEMSTGALAMAHLYKRTPTVSMLVVRLEAEYFKKATSKISFMCEDGIKIEKAIAESIRAGEAQVVKAKSTGINREGEIVAEFFVTWSFKIKRYPSA